MAAEGDGWGRKIGETWKKASKAAVEMAVVCYQYHCFRINSGIQSSVLETARRILHLLRTMPERPVERTIERYITHGQQLADLMRRNPG